MRELKTKRLRLGGWNKDDAPLLAAMNADPDVMRYIGSGVRTYERALAEAQDVIAQGQNGPLGLWAIHEQATGAFCGWAALNPLDGGEEIEIAYRLAQSAWGRGIATEAVARLLRHGFEDLNFNEIVAVTSPANVASQRVLTKLGLQYRGLRDVYGVEGCWYYRITHSAWRRLMVERDN